MWVHIADVAAYVPEGSALDREARRRATSVYLPGAVEPMLPPALSNDACSLLPRAERLAVTVELDVQGDSVARASFYRSLIRSDERLDYERVDRIFAGHEPAAEPWRASLVAAREAAAALQRGRQRRGALVIDTLEPEFLFDAHGDVSEVRARAQTESHRLIEHLMIVANEAVATLLARQRVPCLYRVHERPDPEGISRLASQLASLEVPTPPIPGHFSPAEAEQLAGAISKLLDRHLARRSNGRIALAMLVLRALKQAYYSPRNLGHAGLRSPCYCHFTSPIRRYPDLVCHRALLSAVGAGESAPPAGALAELGAWTSEREREAMTIEREGDDIARCFALERVLFERGWEESFRGEVVGLISAGAFVAFGASSDEQAVDLAAATSSAQAREELRVYEGLLPVRRLAARRERAADASEGRASASGEPTAADWWELNELGTMLQGRRSGARLRLGQPLEVRVGRVDAQRGRVDLLPVGAVAAEG